LTNCEPRHGVMTGKAKNLLVEDQTSVAMVLRRTRVADGLEHRRSHAADPARLDMPVFISPLIWHSFSNIWLGLGTKIDKKTSWHFSGKAKNALSCKRVNVCKTPLDWF